MIFQTCLVPKLVSRNEKQIYDPRVFGNFDLMKLFGFISFIKKDATYSVTSSFGFFVCYFVFCLSVNISSC